MFKDYLDDNLNNDISVLKLQPEKELFLRLKHNINSVKDIMNYSKSEMNKELGITNKEFRTIESELKKLGVIYIIDDGVEQWHNVGEAKDNLI